MATEAARQTVTSKPDEMLVVHELRREFAQLEAKAGIVLRLLATLRSPPGTGVFAIWWSYVRELFTLSSRLHAAGASEWRRRLDQACPYEEPVVAGVVPTMKLASVLKHWLPGSHDEPSAWSDEFAEIWQHDAEKVLKLERSARVVGIQEPIVLGTDGRVWDGHLRLLVAMRLGLDRVPVEIADPDDQWSIVPMEPGR